MSSQAASHADHPPHLAHHFDTPVQQFESGKLGMWLFLGTELLMFGGLFCAYAINRAIHPEIFQYAHRFLDTQMGAINTVVLICSSLTMAWAVRAAQLGQRGLLIGMLFLTLACAGGFMGIKYVEYSHKIHHGLLWGTNYVSQEGHGHGGEAGHGAEAGHAAEAVGGPGAADAAGHGAGEAGTAQSVEGAGSAHAADGSPEIAGAADAGSAAGAAPAAEEAPAGAEASLIPRAAAPPSGIAAAPGASQEAGHEWHGEVPANPQIFFGIYFAMTGLHGIHVLAGMVVIGWLIVGAFRGVYGPEYFTPVDLVGLYWHIVDLIWIFLFPLLYLIH